MFLFDLRLAKSDFPSAYLSSPLRPSNHIFTHCRRYSFEDKARPLADQKHDVHLQPRRCNRAVTLLLAAVQGCGPLCPAWIRPRHRQVGWRRTRTGAKFILRRANVARSFRCQAKDDFLIGRDGISSQIHGPALCDTAAHSSIRHTLLGFLYSAIRGVSARKF